MKKITLLAALAALVLASCAGNPEGKKAETKDSVEVNTNEVVGTAYNVDTQASKVVWIGSKVKGSHTGTVNIKSGSFHVDGGKLTGGNFVLDMTSISSTDLEGEHKEKLDGHLKNEDFFAVDANPEASFTITEVKPGATEQDLIISGNLVIKGTSKNITFDAKVTEATETEVKATANFNIERTQWGVNYTGPEDNLISKEINFDVNIVAKK